MGCPTPPSLTCINVKCTGDCRDTDEGPVCEKFKEKCVDIDVSKCEKKFKKLGNDEKKWKKFCKKNGDRCEAMCGLCA